jgi:hypothetical protein
LGAREKGVSTKSFKENRFKENRFKENRFRGSFMGISPLLLDPWSAKLKECCNRLAAAVGAVVETLFIETSLAETPFSETIFVPL